jgi:disease resistance protein RPM1
LNELVNRSLLQVIMQNEFGRVSSCRMHDIIHHLALNKAEEECFGKVYESSSTFPKDGIRRLSIQRANISSLSQSSATHLRAIYAFECDVNVDLLRPVLESSSLLSTLDLQGTQIKVLPNELFSLFNLRFLGIRRTRIEILPEALGRLQNLEVLDALGTGLTCLPKSVAKLNKLRFLYACTMVSDGRIQDYGAVKVPRGIGNLTRLHALQNIKASLETLSDVAALTELRTFAVRDVTSEHSSNLCTAIMNMSYLVHLSIHASNENEVLPLDTLRLPGTLSKLELIGQLEKKVVPRILSSWSQLVNLTKLYLSLSKIDEELFSRLLVLHGLCFLGLIKAYDGKILYFPASSFPRLRELVIWDAQELNRVEIEEGALKSLAALDFNRCPKLRGFPHGIHYLTALEELCWDRQMLKSAEIRNLGKIAEKVNVTKSI